jgi:glycosyltransferase involved in cell wall biosynthesis
MIGFTDRREVAERMELLGMLAVVVGSARSIVELSSRYANNRAQDDRARPESLRGHCLSQSYRTLESRRVLIQMNDCDQGGLENVVLYLAMGLRQRGTDVTLLVVRKLGPAAEQARQAGFPVLTLPTMNREQAYREILERHGIELVNAHYSTYGARTAHELGVPFVQVVQNSYVWLDRDAIAEYREADCHTTGYLCVSAEAAHYCDVKLRLSVSKMIVVPNGVDGARLEAARESPTAELRQELGLSPDDCVFLNVASVHGAKGQKVLIKALAKVVKTQPHVRLLIVGSASDLTYEAELRRMIARLRLQRHVILAGQRDDVARFYWMADAFVLSSFWEGWSLALTEAVFAGLPVVATDVGGARELLPASGGRLVRPPFSSICELSAQNIGSLVRHEDRRLVASFAQAMREVSSSCRRIVVPDSRKRVLDQEHMVDLHSSILGWFLQGGDAAAARAWTRRTTQTDPVIDSTGPADRFPAARSLIHHPPRLAGSS